MILGGLTLCLSGCAEMVSMNRMKMAPAREASCRLELVEADMMELSPMGTKWDLLGIVSIGANHGVEPMSDKARALIRPKACELGGTAVALMQAAQNSLSMGGQSSAIQFAVLRPKQAASSAPTQF
jgi:hypothetical protein